MDNEKDLLVGPLEGDGQEKQEKQERKSTDERTFTQEELNRIVSKRLSEELEKRDKKAEEEKRLASLSEKERQAELIRQKDGAIKERDEKIRLMELKEDTTKLLADEGIDISFMSFLMAENAEETKANIDAFKVVYADAIQEEVEKRLAGKTPTTAETRLDAREKTEDKAAIFSAAKII